MSRRLEQRTYYPGVDLYDEWEPVNAEQEHMPDVTLLSDADVAQVVRKWNAEAKARGDNTRIRSVDDSEEEM
jgi:hypothetical protein